MRKRQQSSNFQVTLDDGVLARQKSKLLVEGLYLFEDKLKIGGTLRATIITCTGWLLELYALRAGQLSFKRGRELVLPNTERFGVLYSPFSICEPCFEDVEGGLIGVAAVNPLPQEFTANPVLFDSDFTDPPSTLEQVIEILKAGNNRQSVALNSNPSLLSLKTKRLIDLNYVADPSISRIAERLGVTPEHVSRQFKSDFGMSPSNYLRRLRMADAPLKLAKGETIINVSQEVGYNDLSRFYKQFRKTTASSPGACKTILKAKS